MYRLELVTHPLKIASYIKTEQVTVQLQRSVGCLGLNKYIVTTDLKQEILEIQAQPFELVLMTDTLKYYNLTNYLEMLKLFFELRIGKAPDSFIILRFSEPKTTHIYPVMEDGYLYACKEERDYIFLEPYTLLGLKPVIKDPLCWFSMQVPRHVMYGGACLVRAEDYNPDTSDLVEKTIQLMEQARRSGITAVVTKIDAGEFDTGDFKTCRMQFGPIRFYYNSERDLYRDKSSKPDFTQACLSCKDTKPLDSISSVT
jgi:hypothetical protein